MEIGGKREKLALGSQAAGIFPRVIPPTAILLSLLLSFTDYHTPTLVLLCMYHTIGEVPNRRATTLTLTYSISFEYGFGVPRLPVPPPSG